MGWVMEVKGREADLDLLASKLNDNGLKVIKKDEKYFLESEDINEKSSNDFVWEFRNKYEALINGILKLFISDCQDVEINLQFQDENGKQGNFYRGQLVAPNSFVTAFIGETKSQLPVGAILAVAKESNAVEFVFRLVQNGDFSWYNLYKIFEVIREDLGRNQFAGKPYVDKENLSRFTHTCNNGTIIGNMARHAPKLKESPKKKKNDISQDPPPTPMSYGEAKDFIVTMAWEWIQEKIADEKNSPDKQIKNQL